MALTIQEQERRERQRAWRNGELLDSKNEYGISDPTPKTAVKNITDSKMSVVMKAPERNC